MRTSFVKKIAAQTVMFSYLFVLLSALPAFANKAILKDIEVAATDDSQLLLYFKVAGWFTEDMKKAIDNGANTTLNFFVRFYEVRGLLWDRKLTDVQVTHEVQYDNFKKVYRVKLSERGNNTVSVRDSEEVEKLVSEIMALKVAELKDLQTGARYEIRMMAGLDKTKLPFYLHKVFFFLPLWDLKTDWYTVDFTY